MYRWILLAVVAALVGCDMGGKEIVTCCEVDYDFCRQQYGNAFNDRIYEWKFQDTTEEEETGTTGSVTGSVAYEDSLFDRAAEFSSGVLDTQLTLSDAQVGEEATVIATVQNSSASAQFGAGASTGSNAFSINYSPSAGRIQVDYGDTFLQVDSPNPWTSTTGYQTVVVRVQNGTIEVFVNSSTVQGSTTGATFSGTTQNLKYGEFKSGALKFDQLSVHGRAFTDDEITAVTQQNGFDGTESNPHFGRQLCQAILGTTGDAKCFNTRTTCQDVDNYNAGTKPLRFFMPVGDMISPTTRAKMGALPSVASLSTAPARIRPGEDLGERASVSVQFRDHPYHDRTVDKYALERISGDAQADSSGYNPAERGTYWGKWRARNPYFQNRPLRIIQGTVDQLDADPVSLTEMETRHYVMESIEGPTSGGSFTITAKDILKLADEDRAQAPAASQGVLDADITDSATSATLSPAGIGDSEYPSSGHVTIENEIMEFTRSGDTLTLTRAQYGTAAEAHGEGDTVQLAIEYDGVKASAIVEDLLVNYANVSSAFIPSAEWTNEDDTHINRLFTAIIVEPTSVRELIGQLCEQVGFTIWWNEISQRIEFRVIRQPGVAPMTLTDSEHFLQGSIKVKEQQKKRVSQVWVYYGVIDPTEDLEEARNYRSVYVDIDTDAESDNEYQKPKIKKVYARWIDRFNQAAAEDMAGRILSRFRDAPRKFDFSLKWDQAGVSLGNTYDAHTRLMQTFDGQPDDRRIIVLSYERGEEQINVESEEFLYTPDPTDTVHRVIVDADTTQMADGSPFNLRDAHDRIYTDVTGSDTVELIVADNATLGSNSPDDPACNIGTWPAGTTVKVIVNGRIEGYGGDGGTDDNTPQGLPGESGGVAFFTRNAVDVDNQGAIWGGAGGGGGGGGTFGERGGGGGGGAGFSVGLGGAGNSASNQGSDGTKTDGGAGGSGEGDAGRGGDGGDPAMAGSPGEDTFLDVGGAGGAPGGAIDGLSFITFTTTGDIRGSQVN